MFQNYLKIAFRNIIRHKGHSFINIAGLAVGMAAWPLSWYFIDRWLQGFAYRMELGPGLFALGAVLALAIASMTVGFQAVRAASANPVDALRYE